MIRFCVVFILLVSSASVYAMGNMQAEQAYSHGRAAPDFSLETTDGTTQNLSQVSSGKKTILFFWATWCPHCHVGLERVRQNLEAIQQNGVQVLLIDVGETREQAKAFLKRQGILLESFIDEDNTVSGQYCVRGLPTMVFIDEKGIIRDIDHEFPTDYLSRFNSR